MNLQGFMKIARKLFV